MPWTFRITAEAAKVSAYPFGAKVPKVLVILPAGFMDREPCALAAVDADSAELPGESVRPHN